MSQQREWSRFHHCRHWSSLPVLGIQQLGPTHITWPTRAACGRGSVRWAPRLPTTVSHSHAKPLPPAANEAPLLSQAHPRVTARGSPIHPLVSSCAQHLHTPRALGGCGAEPREPKGEMEDTRAAAVPLSEDQARAGRGRDRHPMPGDGPSSQVWDIPRIKREEGGHSVIGVTPRRRHDRSLGQRLPENDAFAGEGTREASPGAAAPSSPPLLGCQNPHARGQVSRVNPILPTDICRVSCVTIKLNDPVLDISLTISLGRNKVFMLRKSCTPSLAGESQRSFPPFVRIQDTVPWGASLCVDSPLGCPIQGAIRRGLGGRGTKDVSEPDGAKFTNAVCRDPFPARRYQGFLDVVRPLSCDLRCRPRPVSRQHASRWAEAPESRHRDQ